MDNAKPIKNYKDTIFRMVFEEKKELLSLYNAINETNYANEDELEINTLENAIYMHMKNDISCLLDMRLQLYEQQSTVNPNMPLRDLFYVCDQYQKLVVKKDIYTKKLIKIPAPLFVVFYNGEDAQPERKELYLSSAFERPQESPNLELRVLQLNINTGYNNDLMRKCPTLFEYMVYVNKVRTYRNEMSLKKAVDRAVDECIEEGILRDFLLKNKAEVTRMSIYEYDEELHHKTLREEGFEDGLAQGVAQGSMTKLREQVEKKLAKGKSVEEIADALEEDVAVIEEIIASLN